MVDELVARGHRGKALLRSSSDLRGLRAVEFEGIQGDVSQGDRLQAAMRGCDWCFHAAASYHLWLKDYAPMYAANVEGTRTVLEEAAQAGCSRIVYTSTVGCIGLPEFYRGHTCAPTDETAPIKPSQLSNDYKISKWRAEVLARKLAAKG